MTAPGREELARVIWNASRADEGTISATGANIVADALLASPEFARLLTEARAEAWGEGHRVGWEHHQDGNYGTDWWDDDTPNPYRIARTAAQPATSTEADDPWCRSEDCKHRWWRSGGMPTHRRGADCPEPATSTEERR